MPYEMKYAILLKRHLNLMATLKAAGMQVTFDEKQDCTLTLFKPVTEREPVLGQKVIVQHCSGNVNIGRRVLPESGCEFVDADNALLCNIQGYMEIPEL